MAGEGSAATDDANLSSLVSSASLVLVGSLFGSFSKLFEQVLLGNVLSDSAWNAFSIAFPMMMFSTTIALVGFNQGIPRFMSRFHDDRDVRGVWVTGLVIAGGAALAIASGIVILRGPVRRVFFNPDTPILVPVLFATAIPLVVGLRVAVGAIRGHENTIYRTYAYDLLYNGLRVGLLLALLFGLGLGVFAAGYAYIIAAGVAFVVAHVFLNRLLPLRGLFRTHAGALLRFSAPLVIASAVSSMLSQIDKLMLGALASAPNAAGVYNYGYPLAAGLPVILSVFGFLYMPLASRLDNDSNREEVDRVYKVTTKWIYIAAFPLFLTFVAFPGDVVAIVFSETDPRSATVLAILSIGFFMSAANGRCQDTLSAFGYTTYILAVNTVTAVLNIALNLVMIPTYGVVGAAVASAVSFFVLNATAMLVLWRTTGIAPFSKWTVRAFLVLPLGLFPPALVLSDVITLSVITLPVFGILAGLAAVTLVAVTGCLQPEDEVPIDLVEQRLGVRIPLIRRYIPSGTQRIDRDR
ncbi:oligosaccharide flippase family protein [Halococcus saccharolyticus]|uniref:Polysaccharide biosynthesis protein n=1 Tax=Halococcus saccharolyticus DSM 5350 TaxID=1227455 RepID=M0MI10_9EURY|nr:oligosaccharide flippase family protein [Halococcus saccharolyticus]EMA45362.1 polysaccharide biosynthesis protein [Halococcus saccharolyticus DSM 5350]